MNNSDRGDDKGDNSSNDMRNDMSNDMHNDGFADAAAYTATLKNSKEVKEMIMMTEKVFGNADKLTPPYIKGYREGLSYMAKLMELSEERKRKQA